MENQRTDVAARLRTAVSLLPVIEAGLRDGKMSVEKASLMASFCEWAAETPGAENDPSFDSLREGLVRLRDRLS